MLRGASPGKPQFRDMMEISLRFSWYRSVGCRFFLGLGRFGRLQGPGLTIHGLDFGQGFGRASQFLKTPRLRENPALKGAYGIIESIYRGPQSFANSRKMRREGVKPA